MTSQETQGSQFYPQKERQVKECEMGNSSQNAIPFKIHFFQQPKSKSIIDPWKGRKQLGRLVGTKAIWLLFLYVCFVLFSKETDINLRGQLCLPTKIC